MGDEEEHLTSSNSFLPSASSSEDELDEFSSSASLRYAAKSSLPEECTGESVTTLICITVIQQNQIRNQHLEMNRLYTNHYSWKIKQVITTRKPSETENVRQQTSKSVSLHIHLFDNKSIIY